MIETSILTYSRNGRQCAADHERQASAEHSKIPFHSICSPTSVTKKKSKKQSEYLAVGEFDVGQVVNTARACFLWTIREKVPRVSIQLRDEVLNTFPVDKLHIVTPVPSIAKQRWNAL